MATEEERRREEQRVKREQKKAERQQKRATAKTARVEDRSADQAQRSANKEERKQTDMSARVSSRQAGRADEEVVVSKNVNGEATNGTTLEGDTDPVMNTDSIPQNGVTEIETDPTPAPNEVAEEADAARTAEEIAFADEANPNMKARNKGAPDKYDQDGNLRGSGYSYGVAADDDVQPTRAALAANKGVDPGERENFNDRVFVSGARQLNNEEVAVDGTEEDKKALEDQFSKPEEGIKARVVVESTSFHKIKIYKDGKPLGIYKSFAEELDTSEVQEFIEKLMDKYYELHPDAPHPDNSLPGVGLPGKPEPPVEPEPVEPEVEPPTEEVPTEPAPEEPAPVEPPPIEPVEPETPTEPPVEEVPEEPAPVEPETPTEPPVEEVPVEEVPTEPETPPEEVPTEETPTEPEAETPEPEEPTEEPPKPTQLPA